MSIKNKFKEELESIHKSLIEVSDWMYENPELGFEEYKTSEYLVNFIKSFQDNVIFPTGDLETAFEITFGKEGPLVVLCVEYDALPEIGHACGHNVIATASIGAGIALRNLVDELGVSEIAWNSSRRGWGWKNYIIRQRCFRRCKMFNDDSSGTIECCKPYFYYYSTI